MFSHIYSTHSITHILSYIHLFTTNSSISSRLTFAQSSSLVSVHISTSTKQPPQQLRKVIGMAQTDGAHDISRNFDDCFLNDDEVYDPILFYSDETFGALSRSIRTDIESVMESPYQQQPHASGPSPPVSPMLHSQRRTRKTDIFFRVLMRSRHQIRLRILQHHRSKS